MQLKFGVGSLSFLAVSLQFGSRCLLISCKFVSTNFTYSAKVDVMLYAEMLLRLFPISYSLMSVMQKIFQSDLTPNLAIWKFICLNV